jgi:hypothetical protein
MQHSQQWGAKQQYRGGNDNAGTTTQEIAENGSGRLFRSLL